MKKRSMVLFLALVMAVGLCVTTAWADGVGYFDPTASGSEQNKICETYTLVTGSAGTDPVFWTGGTSKDAPAWYVVNENVTISGTVNITGHVCLILCDGKTLTVNGITVDDGGSLTINGQSGQSGKLLATGACVEGTNSYSYSYGISGGTLTFNGGVIEATGGTANSSYGIVASKTITINAGTLTATGGEANAESYGICGYRRLTIKNGTVIAETTADGDIVEKAAVFYGEAYSMPDAYGTAWWWRTVKDGAYQGHPSFIVSDFESDYFELITTDPYPHQHTRRQPTATTSAPADSDKGTEDKSDVVTSAKTFDAGVAVYAVLGVLSLTGSAWVARKKW